MLVSLKPLLLPAYFLPPSLMLLMNTRMTIANKKPSIHDRHNHICAYWQLAWVAYHAFLDWFIDYCRARVARPGRARFGHTEARPPERTMAKEDESRGNSANDGDSETHCWLVYSQIWMPRCAFACACAWLWLINKTCSNLIRDP